MHFVVNALRCQCTLFSLLFVLCSLIVCCLLFVVQMQLLVGDIQRECHVLEQDLQSGGVLHKVYFKKSLGTRLAMADQVELRLYFRIALRWLTNWSNVLRLKAEKTGAVQEPLLLGVEEVADWNAETSNKAWMEEEQRQRAAKAATREALNIARAARVTRRHAQQQVIDEETEEEKSARKLAFTLADKARVKREQDAYKQLVQQTRAQVKSDAIEGVDVVMFQSMHVEADGMEVEGEEEVEEVVSSNMELDSEEENSGEDSELVVGSEVDSEEENSGEDREPVVRVNKRKRNAGEVVSAKKKGK